MRAFDFDNTIYDGESVFDFYLFSIRYNPRVAKYIPIVFFNLFKYKLGKTTMQDLEQAVKKYSRDYLDSFDNKEELVSIFWDKPIDEFYTDNMVDKPMIDIAKSAYFVKGNKIKKIK